ncbi:hypothetical protein KUCAC02_001081 [Chaenocephalus aceratus]|uniref:Uncharacterized protein n=1 Tax=Chaenocephalus aceratus TaxID=36190 RepID=A0ACB9XV56_CHAAC|nr:hypothetical protein KUCAC02_001081 [Chaenocephalus aceratus]
MQQGRITDQSPSCCQAEEEKDEDCVDRVFRWQRGERIPSKFDQRDYKPPRTRSFKAPLCCLRGPQYITPCARGIYQSQCRSRSPRIRLTKREELAEQTTVLTRRGQENVRHGQQRSNDAFNGRRFITRGGSGQGAVASVEAICNDRRPCFRAP